MQSVGAIWFLRRRKSPKTIENLRSVLNHNVVLPDKLMKANNRFSKFGGKCVVSMAVLFGLARPIATKAAVDLCTVYGPIVSDVCAGQ